MIPSTIFAVLLSAQAPAGQPPVTEPSLTEENRAVIRCSAAFALIAARQDDGDPDAQQWPALTERGREFFVRSLAGIMDQHSLDRRQIASLVRAESLRMHDTDQPNQLMPACLLMLDATGV